MIPEAVREVAAKLKEARTLAVKGDYVAASSIQEQCLRYASTKLSPFVLLLVRQTMGDNGVQTAAGVGAERGGR